MRKIQLIGVNLLFGQDLSINFLTPSFKTLKSNEIVTQYMYSDNQSIKKVTLSFSLSVT